MLDRIYGLRVRETEFVKKVDFTRFEYPWLPTDPTAQLGSFLDLNHIRIVNIHFTHFSWQVNYL